MNFMDTIINWLEQNWGTAIFGGMSLGTVVTTVIVLVKQWVSNKAQGTKYETMWNSSQQIIADLKTAYDNERLKNTETSKEKVFLQASQTVLMDAMIKMAMASKLDVDDKVSIVANVERLKLMTPQEIVEDVKEKTETVVTNVTTELEANPVQTIVNLTNSAGTLLDKYSSKNG